MSSSLSSHPHTKPSGTKRPLHIRPARADDTRYIISLSASVQTALTASGSLQEIGPLARTVVETSIQGSHAYLLELNGQPIGSVLIDPLDGVFVNTANIAYVSWGVVENLPGPFWYLHALMLEPADQGSGLGREFLEGVLRLMKMEQRRDGVVILDCWAGNEKLRRFYADVGFQHHGDFPENDYHISVYIFAL